MTFSSIQMVWAVVGGAALLFAAILLIMLRTKRVPSDAQNQDSWERTEERRRRKEMVYGIASYVLLFCCAAVAAALSFHGLVGFGRENLNLGGGWEYLVPFGLDGAAMFCSVLAVREASHGDAALGSRLLVWLFAFASAWFNWVHAPRGGGHDGAPQFFSGMSISAAILFDRALKQTRKAALREQGLVPRPLPQIRMVRWMRAPRETYAAWSLMLLENVRSLDEAVEEVREDRQAKLDSKVRARAADRRERAELKAIAQQGRVWNGRRGGRQVPALTAGAEQSATEPAPVREDAPVGAAALEPASVTGRRAVTAAPESTALPAGRTIDLTADDDTMAMPRLDSLERKLRAIEQTLG
ncbi:DUF2637 domain-containing protein [Peterkaempfera sp. SMS 1(5)a]|uniref:DUF2637 domain-containing protein n=1 Tax=Peterkaempfera podocarpi TaxID=3232308 RepID=UPI00367128FD